MAEPYSPGLLYCGVSSPERGALVARALLGKRFASGWRIRTLGAGEARYNPMSYHNGTVWPHDTALCAAGIARYAGRAPAINILGQMFEAATQFAMRLPVLYCGFVRTPGRAFARVQQQVIVAPSSDSRSGVKSTFISSSVTSSQLHLSYTATRLWTT